MAAADVSALVLAGGQARRLGGVAKHALVIDERDGRTIFERLRDVLAPRVAEILVSAAAGGPDVAGHRTVRDAVAGGGPLAGVAAGLAACATPWLLVIAGDMPAMAGAVIDRLLAERRDDADAVGVRLGGRPEPLVCVLHVRVREVLDRRLAAGRWKASGLLTDEGLVVRWLDEPALRAVDPTLASFRNVNTPEDLGG